MSLESDRIENAYRAAIILKPAERAELIQRLLKTLPAALAPPADPNRVPRKSAAYDDDAEIPF